MIRAAVAIGLITLTCNSAAAAASSQKRRHAKGHEHGKGELNVVVEAGKLQLEMKMPLDNVLGFEHEPKTDADKKKLADALGVLNDPVSFISIEGAGTCSQQVEKVATSFEEGQIKEKSSDRAKQGPDEHAEVAAIYTFTCDNPKGLKSFNMKIFDKFSKLQSLRVNLVGPSGQKSGVLTKSKTLFSW